MPLSKISFREKRIDRRIAAYQSDLIATHYAEVENMYRQTRGWRHDYRNHIRPWGTLRLPPIIWTPWMRI